MGSNQDCTRTDGTETERGTPVTYGYSRSTTGRHPAEAGLEREADQPKRAESHRRTLDATGAATPEAIYTPSEADDE